MSCWTFNNLDYFLTLIKKKITFCFALDVAPSHIWHCLSADRSFSFMLTSDSRLVPLVSKRQFDCFVLRIWGSVKNEFSESKKNSHTTYSRNCVIWWIEQGDHSQTKPDLLITPWIWFGNWVHADESSCSQPKLKLIFLKWNKLMVVSIQWNFHSKNVTYICPSACATVCALARSSLITAQALGRHIWPTILCPRTLWGSIESWKMLCLKWKDQHHLFLKQSTFLPIQMNMFTLLKEELHHISIECSLSYIRGTHLTCNTHLCLNRFF